LPVTARLSQKFYERFGDEIATEFVDWFNAVDSTYQQQLRELNDMNWERFKAELRALKAGLIEKIAQSEARSAEKLAHSESRLGDRIAQLEIRVNERFSELMKWMFIYWLGSLIPISGLVVALLRKG
jgi:DNA anti-recombination protein RmuC